MAISSGKNRVLSKKNGELRKNHEELSRINEHFTMNIEDLPEESELVTKTANFTINGWI